MADVANSPENARSKKEMLATYRRTSLLYKIARYFYGLYLANKETITVEGVHNIPVKGAVIIVANHLQVRDSPYIGVSIRRRVTFLAKSEYFSGTDDYGKATFKAKVSKFGLESIGQIPIDRGDLRKSGFAFKEARYLLEEGHVVGIHGEGTRSKTGYLYNFHPGFVAIARATGAAIVPTALLYSGDGQKAKVIFGPSILKDEYERMSNKEVARLVKHRIHDLNRQPMRNTFAEIKEIISRVPLRRKK